MSGDKRWSVVDAQYPYLEWDGGGYKGWLGILVDDDGADTLAVDCLPDHEVLAAHAALIEDVRDAARLRSLAATFDSHLNRGQTYTGAQVAAMLRDGEG